jgi:hypothetical protein
MIFWIGNLALGAPSGPGILSDGSKIDASMGVIDPGPKNAVWHKANIVEIKQIPGKGKTFKTVRTSDGVLWECDLTVRCITDTRFKDIKNKVDDGGPFEIKCNFGMLNMYLIDGTFTHDENDKEAPLKADNGDFLNVGTWTLKLLEAND